jgi:hypothetical protein
VTISGEGWKSHFLEFVVRTAGEFLPIAKYNLYFCWRAAWLQVSNGNADIRAVVKTNGDFIHAGGVEARSGCWSILKGGLTAAAAGPAELYFEVHPVGTACEYVIIARS